MDDQFLNDQRRDPDPAFARDLRERLRAAEDAGEARSTPRWRALLVGAMAVAAAVALFALPAVRATAQQLLDLFRVREFAVVQVDENRLEQIKAHKIDPQMLLGDKVEKLQEAGPPRRFTSIEAATAAAGFVPTRPSVLPRGLALDTVEVRGESRMRVTLDTRPMRELLQALDLRDVELPAGLDGRVVEFHAPVSMVQDYRGTGRARAALLQSASPEVSLPPGVDLTRLGEAGLRILGLDRDEAHRVARTIDWRSTVLVPIVTSATRFQQVSIHGARGLYLETSGTGGRDGGGRGPGSAVVWSANGRVFAVLGNLDAVSMMQMAESVR